MEKRVQFRDRQEVTASDLDNIGLYAQESMDDVVRYGITDELRYVGFDTVQESATSVRVGVGRVFNDGEVFIAENEAVFNLFNNLPLVNKRIISLYAFGQEQDNDTQQRDFLINADTQETEPKAVAMQKLRIALLQTVIGVESVDPQPAALPDNACLVATVLLTTTGVSAITMEQSTKLTSVESNTSEIADLKVWRNQTDPKVGALTSELAALRVSTQGKVGVDDFLSAIGDIARLKDKANLPASYSQYSADFFENTAQTDTGATGLTAKVDHGLLFPDAGVATAPVALFNPFDASVYRSPSDLVLPKHDLVTALKTEGYVGDISISQYQVQTHTVQQFTAYNYYYYYGWAWNWYGWWYARASMDGGYTSTIDWGYPWGYWQAVPYTYYQDVTTTTAYNGVMIGQTFVAPRKMWLTKAGLFFTKVAATGDVKVLVCECDYGKPNLAKTITQTTLTPSDLKKYPTETVIDIPAAFLDAGKRYALVLITQGDHYVARVDASKFTQGTLFYGSDGDYFTGDLTKDLMFNLYAASFKQARTEVMLQNVSLAGGITDLKIATPQLVPEGCELSYEVQVGGKWYPLSDTGRLSNAPDIVPLRAVFIGTTDVQPALQLKANAITASRPALALTHYSAVRTLSSAKQNFRVDVVVSQWDAAKNTVAVKLLTGGSYATETAHSSLQVLDEDDTGLTKRLRFTFALGAAVSTFKLKTTATRTADGAPFAIVERTDVAVS